MIAEQAYQQSELAWGRAAGKTRPTRLPLSSLGATPEKAWISWPPRAH